MAAFSRGKNSKNKNIAWLFYLGIVSLSLTSVTFSRYSTVIRGTISVQAVYDGMAKEAATPSAATPSEATPSEATPSEEAARSKATSPEAVPASSSEAVPKEGSPDAIPEIMPK